MVSTALNCVTTGNYGAAQCWLVDREPNWQERKKIYNLLADGLLLFDHDDGDGVWECMRFMFIVMIGVILALEFHTYSTLCVLSVFYFFMCVHNWILYHDTAEWVAYSG